jgi:hypothetical protein
VKKLPVNGQAIAGNVLPVRASHPEPIPVVAVLEG